MIRDLLPLALVLAACGAPSTEPDAGDGPDAGSPDAGAPIKPDPFADRIVSFAPGEGAGFGQDKLPDVVLGPPKGGGASAGSLDVLSLGRAGEIVLELVDVVAVDGPGADLLVFENPFSGFVETAVVAASADGTDWRTWPCEPEAEGRPGCAGLASVHQKGWDGTPLDPASAGGDAFDLAEIGLSRARFVRLIDSGANAYGGTGGGFDLDAVGVVNGEVPAP